MANIGYYESSLATYNNVKKGFIDENKHQIGSLTKEEFDASFFKVNDDKNTLLYLGDKLISNSKFEGFEGRIVALENQINDIDATDNLVSGIGDYSILQQETEGSFFNNENGNINFNNNENVEKEEGPNGEINIQIGAFGKSSASLNTKSQATGDYSLTEGNSTVALGEASHAEGKFTFAEGNYSHAEGFLTNALGEASHAEGYTLDITQGSYGEDAFSDIIASGKGAHAEGVNTHSLGNGTHAEGQFTLAENSGSHAEGVYSKAIGISSHAEGRQTQATAEAAHSEGKGSQATGIVSHAEGYQTQAIGEYSHAEGEETQATARGAHAEGSLTKSQGNYSHAEGSLTTASKQASHAEGFQTKAQGIASHSEGGQTQTKRDYSHAEGYYTQAQGIASHAEGYGVTENSIIALGSGSHAGGYVPTSSGSITAIGSGSHAEGSASKNVIQASGLGSHAEGYAATSGVIASGTGSHAEGYDTKAQGNFSHTEGWETIAIQDCQHVQGKYNIKSENNSAVGLDERLLFIVGNGGENNRSNAHTLAENGDAWYQGIITSTGADYAEYFEWEDKNPNNEDRVGYIVSLNGDKIHMAKSDDEILGIISSTAAILGDNYKHEWNGKYLTDDFGRKIYEDVEEFIDEPVINEKTGEIAIVKKSLGFFKHPKLNPAYDPSQEYVNRAKRPEWDAVGMLGKLHVRDDGTCIPNYYAAVGEDGKATFSALKTNMRVLSRVNDHIVRVLLK